MPFHDEEEYASHYLRWSQLECPCGRCEGLPEDAQTLAELRETAVWADDLRAAVGGWPLLIVAGWWCPEWAEEQGETDGIAHVTGHALDFVVRQKSPRNVQIDLNARHPDLIQGLGSLSGYTHARRGGVPDKWRK